MEFTEVVISFNGTGFRFSLSDGNTIFYSGVSARTTYRFCVPTGCRCLISASKNSYKETRYIACMPPCSLSVFFSFSNDERQRFMLSDTNYGFPVKNAVLHFTNNNL